MAVVADEYGGVSGIVTLQDLIERIFGGVADEFDPPHATTLRVDGGRVFIPGTLLLIDFNDWFESSLARRDTNTLAGLLTELNVGVPETGQKIKAGDFTFKVEATDTRTIKEVSLAVNDELIEKLREQGVL